MKYSTMAIALLACICCFGQQTKDSTEFKELKEHHKKISDAMEKYDVLSDTEKQEVNTACGVAGPLYDYLVAKQGITQEEADTYNVGLLCQKLEGKEEFAKLQKLKVEIDAKQSEFQATLDLLKPTEKQEDFENATTKLNALKGEISNLCTRAKEQVEVVKKNGTIDEDVINSVDITSCVNFKKLKTEESKEPRNFIIVGKNDPIDADSLFEKGTAQKFFRDIIGIEGRARLGTFKILPDGGPVELYVKTKSRKIKNLENSSESYVTISSILKNKNELNLLSPKDSNENIEDIFKSSYVAKVFTKAFSNQSLSSENNNNFFPEKVLFKSIAFETREGGMVDIRLQTLSTDEKVELYFESEAPVSMLSFTRRAKRSFLVFSNKFNDKTKIPNFDYRFLDQTYIRVSDIIKYLPDPGNNFVPEDIALTLPADLETEHTENIPRKYELINDSSLSNLLDLRTYTDFLGLFADESNGLFQIEGKADFFLNPFNFNRSSIYIYKKVTPFIRYSRLEEENSFISTLFDDDTLQLDDSRLELLEKSNLEFGLDVNMLSYRLFKESPVWFSLHLPVNVYNTKIRPTTQDGDSDPNGVEEPEPRVSNGEMDINFTTFGIGVGASMEVKRLSNFGLNLGYSIKNYSALGDYTVDNLREPDNFWVGSLDAELFYYPGEDERQSIFLRMRGFREIGDNGSAFQQLQFGYRFTLGLNKVKAKD